MKKILSIAFTFALALNTFATGSVAINTPQSGYDTFATNSPAYTSITNVFSPAFTYTPVVSVFLTSGPTNALPLTTVVTTSNLVVTINTSTNCAVVWSANAGFQRIQTGSFTTVVGVATNVTFPTAFAYAPTIYITGNNTNAASGTAITAVTTTNFTAISYVAQTNMWGALGISATPGTSTVTY
jgi:hypothetical protein